MLFRRLYDDTLAQASYLIGCQRTGEAIVVDPLRDPDRYLEAAAEEGMRIVRVTETHIHADYLSGSRELARRAGAELLLSAHGGPDWSYRFAETDGATLVADGDVFSLGAIRFEVLHTPGHTPEHICFLVTDTAATEEPMGLLSGDFLLVGDVGRPDLHETAAGFEGTMEAGARDLYCSLERIRELPDHLQLWPGHGAGSACGKALGAVPTSTLGYERVVNWALAHDTEEGFVAEVLSDQPEPPTYFATMKRLNRDGPPLLVGPVAPTRLPDDALGEHTGGHIVDLRPRDAWKAAHRRGSVSLPFNRSFLNWSGWLLDPEREILLVAADQEEATAAAQALALIGLDRVRGWVGAEAVPALPDPGSAEIVPVETAHARARVGELLIDVRGRSEVQAGRPEGSRHIHLGHLHRHLDELPDDAPILVSCQSGGRSAIAQSVLMAAGKDAVDVAGGWLAWTKAELPATRPEAPAISPS